MSSYLKVAVRRDTVLRSAWTEGNGNMTGPAWCLLQLGLDGAEIAANNLDNHALACYSTQEHSRVRQRGPAASLAESLKASLPGTRREQYGGPGGEWGANLCLGMGIRWPEFRSASL